MRQLHRVEPAALVGVDKVHARSFDAQPHFARAGLRQRDIVQPHFFHATGFMNSDCLHRAKLARRDTTGKSPHTETSSASAHRAPPLGD
jgi:hypothetical protein